MAHRAGQVIEAIAELVRARVEPLGVHVYTHRRESLDETQDELPAISVDYAEDAPDELYGDLSDTSSVLTVECSAVAVDAESHVLREKLLELRTDIHRAIKVDGGYDLGLSFVNATRYGPTARPEISAEGETFTGTLVCMWFVHYSMGDDPTS